MLKEYQEGSKPSVSRKESETWKEPEVEADRINTEMTLTDIEEREKKLHQLKKI